MARRRSFGSIRKLPSGRYQASYRDGDHAERVVAPVTFKAKADATLWLSTVEADRSRGELLDPRLAQRPFAEWAEEWLAGLHLKPKTLVGYESVLRNHLLPELGDRPVSTITYRDCRRLIDTRLAAGMGAGTAGGVRKILRLILEEAVRADALKRNPANGIRIPRGRRDEMVFLEADQVLRLADAVANPPAPREPAPQLSLLVRLAAFTGLRAGEIAALRRGRVNPLRGWLEVAESVQEVHGELIYGPTKTYAVRRVPVPAHLAAELGRHLDAGLGDERSFVFTSPSGGPLRHSNFYARFYKPAVRRAGLDPRTRFHDLRHTAAALMIAEGAHLLAVKERLGHSTIQVTADRYGHLFPSLEAALTDRLDAAYERAQERHQRAGEALP